MVNFSWRTLPNAVQAWLAPGKALVSPDPASKAAPGHEVWIEQLRLVSSRLGSVSTSTEDEFLAIGERLQDFQQRAGEITTIISSLVSSLGGERGAAAMSGLAAIFNDLESHLAVARKESGRQSLELILLSLDRITTPLTGFARMNKNLKMLGVYAKIESARLGEHSAVFETLTKNVSVLSDEVIGKADAILLQKNQLAITIGNALADVVSMGAEKQDGIQTVLGKTRQSLHTLTSIVDRCSSSAGAISLSSAVVAENLGQVVVALQAHDTVRQQIEHVAEALEELAGRLPEPGMFQQLDPDDRGHLAVETGMVCEIQAAQLRHASAELLNAVECIIGSLRGIAIKESEMSNDTVELVGVTDQAGASFFTEMGNDLTEVITMLTAAAATSRKLSGILTAATATVGEIFHFVDDIENIVYAIKLIALNFLIQADGLGGSGGGLGVLADAISRLSVEAREQAEGVTGILVEIKALTDGMCRSVSAEAAAMEARVGEMRQEVEGMLASLQQMNGEMAQQLTRTNAMVQELSTDIEEVVRGITVHQQVAAVIGKADTMLGAISQGAKVLLPADKWAEETEKFRAADSRYTMHSERHIHAAVLNGPPAADGQPLLEPPHGAVTEAPRGGSDDLGDNVELF
ncbi:MAG: methyl-accepting chemotaxis protein [Thermodesulfobacteriota bacterium]